MGIHLRYYCGTSKSKMMRAYARHDSSPEKIDERDIFKEEKTGDTHWTDSAREWTPDWCDLVCMYKMIHFIEERKFRC